MAPPPEATVEPVLAKQETPKIPAPLVRLGRETKGRRGKGVTTVSDLPLDDDGVAQVGALLSKGSEAAVIRDAGHFLFAEQPGQVNDRVIRFLEAET